MQSFQIFHFLVIIFWIKNIVCQELKGELVFSHILFRHGDRAPLNSYPNDPWKNLKYWPNGWGQLTNLGKMQQLQLGQWIRRRYSEILNETYSKREIYVQSTDVDRTLMSAEANLAGLFPPKQMDIWNVNLDWQPIPVHTIPQKFDNVLQAKMSCPAYDYAKNQLMQTEEFQNLYAKFGPLFEYVTKKSGKKIDTIENFEYFYNTLFIEKLYNKTLPDWAEKLYENPDAKYLADFSFVIETYTTQMARLKIGPLLTEILDRFTMKAKGKLKPNRKLWMYSAHDTTIANILNTLKLFDMHFPPYAATVLLELRMHKNLPLISIFYRNTTIEEPEPLKIPQCGIQCPLSEMKKIYESVLPNDWNDECKLSTFNLSYVDAPNTQYAMAILLVISSCILATILIIYMISLLVRRRRYSRYRAF